MSKPSVSQNSPSAAPLAGALRWPDGWYVYEDGQLAGPLAASDAFSRPSETAGGKPRLVSRKGFTQWYALRDLAEVFQLTAQMEEKAGLPTALASPSAAVEGPAAVPSRPRVQAKQIDLKTSKSQVPSGLDATSRQGSLSSTSVVPTAALAPVVDEAKGISTRGATATAVATGKAKAADASAAASEVPPDILVVRAKTMPPPPPIPKLAMPIPTASNPPASNPAPAKAATAKAVATQPPPPPLLASAALTAPASALRPPTATTQSVDEAVTARNQTLGKTTLAPSRAAALPVDKTLARKAVVHEYYVARTRLRLGQLRGPWITGLAGLPLSLGVYWPIWYARTERELVQHTQGASFLPRWGKSRALLAAIPGVHLIMTYRLAAQIRAMEQQNRYTNVSPWLAACLALVPPLALIYLQLALNRHWLLHAKHLVIKRRNEAGARLATGQPT